GGQELHDLMHHALSHGQRALAHVERQPQFTHGSDRGPYPVRGARQALDSLRLADLTRLDGPEQGIEFIELHLGDADVVQEISGEGGGVVRHFYQPLQHRVGVHLKHPSDGTDAQPFGHRAHRPHASLASDMLALEGRALGFGKIAAAGYTLELAPRTAARMTVGSEIAAAHPAVIRAIRGRTEMLGYGDRAPAASAEDESRWRSRGAVG